MNRTKKYALAAAALLLVTVVSGRFLASKPAERILVLGFDTRLLNNIQDRLLRETVMRELHVAGYPVVPVMEIESIFHDGRERQIRKVNRDEMKNLCDEMRAGYACCGSITPEKETDSETIRAGSNYICSVTLYHGGKKRFNEIRLRIPGEDNLYSFYTAISKMMAAEIVKLL